MPVIKTVDQRGGVVYITFKDEQGELHRDRGRPAIIEYDQLNNRIYYNYYVHGVRFRPRKKGRDQPNFVCIGEWVNEYIYLNEAEFNNQGIDRPYQVNLRNNHSYEIKYLNLIIIGSTRHKFVYTSDNLFIVGYGMDSQGAYKTDRDDNITAITPERAQSCIPQSIPRGTIMNTPLAYFQPF